MRVPDVHIVAGGPHISTLREKVFSNCASIDYGITLEGEQTIVELCQEDLALSEIQGLIYRDEDQKVIYTGDRPLCGDLDSLPVPTYSRFELERYSLVNFPIVSSRGCPFECIYCPVKTTIGRQYRARDPILVADEVEWWYRRGYQVFEFNDIKPVIPAVDAKMDAQYHRAVEVVATGEPEEDNCIERCFRDGFIYGSIVLRPAEVTVKKYSAEAEVINNATNDEN